VFDIVNESPDKDGFSTACGSYNHASKRNKHGTTRPYPRSSDAYPPSPPPPLPLTEGYTPPPQYSQSNEEEPYYILKTNNPYTFYVPDGYDPDHFMPWVHPFTSVSYSLIRFVHEIV
jgi:hypothetical protein